MNEIDPLLRKSIKLLLLQLAASCDNPGERLQALLSDVIQELYYEAQSALEEKKSKLRLIAGGEN